MSNRDIEKKLLHAMRHNDLVVLEYQSRRGKRALQVLEPLSLVERPHLHTKRVHVHCLVHNRIEWRDFHRVLSVRPLDIPVPDKKLRILR